ncbi:MAG: hypothetical protein ACFFD2_19540, partial [Promethearchaeota archaeon]
MNLKIPPKIDLTKTRLRASQLSNKIYSSLREGLPILFKRLKITPTDINYENAIKVLFFRFTNLMQDYLALILPNMLIFDFKTQKTRQVITKKASKLHYEFLKKYYKGYVSPQEQNEQCLQDMKNIWFLFLQEFLIHGKKKRSTPEELLYQIPYALRKASEAFWQYQDKNLEEYSEITSKMDEEVAKNYDIAVDSQRLLNRNFGTRLVPVMHGDLIQAIEICKLKERLTQFDESRLDPLDKYLVEKEIHSNQSYERKISRFLHRKSQVEEYYKWKMQQILPRCVGLELISHYKNYLRQAFPISQKLINTSDQKAIFDLFSMFQYLFEHYFHINYIKVEYNKLRTEILSANLSEDTFNKLIFDSDNLNVGNKQLEYIQLRPLIKKGSYIYLNGCILIESFLCNIDKIFKMPAFTQFKGHIMELSTATLLREYGIKSYNIVLSNHPTADASTEYKNLLDRDNYLLDPFYKKLYVKPQKIHKKFQ